MRTFLGFIFVILGFTATFWGGFCLLGGPDGAILSRDSFMFAGKFLLGGGLFIALARKLARTGVYIYAPMLVTALAWVVAIVSAQPVGCYIWIVGVPTSAFTCMIYLLVAALRQAKRI